MHNSEKQRVHLDSNQKQDNRASKVLKGDLAQFISLVPGRRQEIEMGIVTFHSSRPGPTNTLEYYKLDFHFSWWKQRLIKRLFFSPGHH